MTKHYVGEVGTQILLDTETALATATLVAIKVEKPDGTTATWTGAVASSTKISYTLTASDFDQAGLYKMQAYVEVDTVKWYGETFEMVVYDVYE